MATPAAVLSILVTANTSNATAGLSKVQTQLAATSRRTDRFTKDTEHAHLRIRRSFAGLTASAVHGAIGFAAAYASIEGAKGAIHATESLAKTTITLKRNFGLSAQAASTWGAVLKANDIDMRSAQMSFTTLAKGISSGSKPAVKAFKDLGLSQRELAKQDFGTVLNEVTAALTNMHGGTKRAADAQILLGRGAKVLAPLFRGDGLGFQQQAKWAEQFGVTLDGHALKSSKDLAIETTKLKFAQMGLQIQFTEKVVPAITLVATTISRLVLWFEKNKSAAVALGSVVAVLTAAWVGYRIAALESAAATAVATGGLSLIIPLLAALAAALVIAYTQSKTFRNIVNSAFTSVKAVAIDVFHAIAPVAIDVFDHLVKAGQGFAHAFEGVIKVFKGVLHGDFGEMWKGIKQVFSGAFSGILNLFGAWTSPMRHAAAAIGNAVKGTLSSAWDSIVKTAQGFINDIIDVLDLLPFVNIKHVGGSKASKGNPHIPAQKLAQGGKVTHPIAIMGEEAPAHPEWVIPTNPAYRKRAIGLWMASARSIGIPGFAAGGALSKVGSAASSIIGKLPHNPFPDPIKGVGRYVLDKAGNFIGDKAKSIIGSIGSVFTSNTTIHGLLPRVLRALEWARGHGWHGSVTSGYRSRAAQQYLWDNAARLGLVRGVSVARPGTSSHETGAAVDVTDIAAFRKAMSSAPPDSRLLWRGASDPVHFSISGFARGGLMRFAKGGLFGGAALANLAAQGGFTKSQIPLAVAIALAESGGRAQASNRNSDGSIDRGLWQINSSHGALSTFNPLRNAKAAFAISHGGHDWKPWATFRSGAYKKFLTRAYSVVGKVKRKSHQTFTTGASGGYNPLTDMPPLPSYTDTSTAGAGSAADTSGGDPNQPLIDALTADADAQKAAADALQALKDEVKRQNDFATSVANVTSVQAVRALADVISGQIVGQGYRGRALTASSGQTVRY